MLEKLYANDGTKKEEFMNTLPPPPSSPPPPSFPPPPPLVSQEHALGDNQMFCLSQNYSELMKIPDAA